VLPFSVLVVFSEPVYVVHYVLLNDAGLVINIQLIRGLDSRQLMTALSRANTTRRYDSYLFIGSVRSLRPFKSLLKLAFPLVVASSSYADIESIVQRFYQNRYPGSLLHAFVLNGKRSRSLGTCG